MLSLLFVSVLGFVNGEKAPTIHLHNAADPTLEMPIMGLGTGGYGAAKSSKAKPEHWNVTEGFVNSIKWFNNEGYRFDTSNTYESQPGVAQALLNISNNWTTVARSKIFITSKIGPGKPLGYNECLTQVAQTLQLFNTTYIDLLLFHWPSANGSSSTSTDPYCDAATSNNMEYDATLCRQSTWKAMELLFNEKKVRAIGVANFEERQLMDIFNLNSLLPAVNQFEFHGYWHEHELVQFCQSYDITVNAYAPLGTPDVTKGYWDPLLPNHPIAVDIGMKYNKTGAQVWLKWILQQDIVTNPRSWNDTHQKQNLDIFDFNLNNEDMLQLSSVQPPQGKNPKVCPDPFFLA